MSSLAPAGRYRSRSFRPPIEQQTLAWLTVLAVTLWLFVLPLELSLS